ncbi:hypothetical protein WJX74_006247 [Apatococcus lobatus]|uniref:Hedgehog protein Hint domain-containing protein n=1 Tax=Apatococcus lobatus TaxID=904363 RepID=A0AAW1QCN6_9CHLO
MKRALAPVGFVVLFCALVLVPTPSQAWSPGVCACKCCAQCNDIHLAGSFHTARSTNCTTTNCGKKLPSECPVYVSGGWGRNEPVFVSTGIVAQLNLVANSLSSACTTQYPELADCFSGYLATQTQGLATLISTSKSKTDCPVGNLTIAGCFPGSASAYVQLEDGTIAARTMEHLAVGDKVLVARTSGELAFEDIFMFSHQSPEVSSFIELSTSDSSNISLSPDHYIHVLAAGAHSTKIVTAAQVKAGDQLWTTSSFAPLSRLQWSTVSGSKKVQLQGLYNPHTASGTIVVNSVLACSFPNTLPPSIAAHRAATMPAWVLYNLIPSKAAAGQLNRLLLHLYFSSASASRHVMHSIIATFKA